MGPAEDIHSFNIFTVLSDIKSICDIYSFKTKELQEE
jgi:hypothetical protein